MGSFDNLSSAHKPFQQQGHAQHACTAGLDASASSAVMICAQFDRLGPLSTYLPTGSPCAASNPAETMTKSGLNSLAIGTSTCSKAAR